MQSVPVQLYSQVFFSGLQVGCQQTLILSGCTSSSSGLRRASAMPSV